MLCEPDPAVAEAAFEFLPILPFVPDLRDDVEENHCKHLQRFR